MLFVRIVGLIDIIIWIWINYVWMNSFRLKINRLCRVIVVRDFSDYIRIIYGLLVNRFFIVNNWMYGVLYLFLFLGLLYLLLFLCLLYLVILRIFSILCWWDEYFSFNRLRWRNIYIYVLRKRIRIYGY